MPNKSLWASIHHNQPENLFSREGISALAAPVMSLEEAIAAYHASDRENPLAVAAALDLWDKLALEAIEAAASLSEVVGLYYVSPIEGSARAAALARWDRLAFQEISQAMTLNDAIVAHNLCHDNSEAEAMALAKIAELKAQARH